MHQIGDHDPERVRAPERETARDGIRLVAELRDLREHARAGRVADVVAVVQHLRNGRDRHAELAGDAFHCGRWGHRALSAAPWVSAQPINFNVKVA